MEIDAPELEKRMANFESVCRKANFKLTHQRIEIFREVAQTGDHPDAENIFQRVRKKLPTVSLDTVYRTLWLLKDLGLIATLGTQRDRTRFDANLTSHHHFVCAECGLTRDFDSDALNAIKLPDTLETIGQVKTTHVEIRGVCINCIANKNS